MKDPRDMTDAELDAQRALIGETKLRMRQATPWQRILRELRPLTQRIELINREDERRQWRR